MDARSALFDLYGDHLRHRGGEAPVAALIRLLGALDVAAPAVRTAVSRMVRQGWLQPVRLGSGPGYALTRKAYSRLDEAATRIYRTRDQAWDGQWHMLVLKQPGDRSTRERVRAGLAFLGYAPLSDNTWVGPRESDEVDALLASDSVHAHRFVARLDGDPAGLAASTWDLAGLGRSYDRWRTDAERLVAEAGDAPSDELSFAVRSRLLHEWRKFLFADPGLPRELLPPRWPGEDAAELFDTEARRLLPGAQRFVTTCLDRTETNHRSGDTT
ncbi:MAG TPA: PaaX family transcriptional regulator C-terminal domain-containing protein [Nocardioidaceae bacterium]|nr:PaaX family transcriptional regulator C-terminal domain-containing protein [Nocardioidaceae bacterium]